MPTNNFLIAPSDGWVQIASSPAFVRVTAFPATHPYYLFAGSSAPALTAAAGTGTVTFTTGVPTNGQTVTIGTEVYTFVTSGATGFQVNIGGSNLLTAVNFAAVVNTASQLVNASNASGTVTLTAKAVGTQGNYALSTNASHVSVSGAAFTGGADTVPGILMCQHPFKVNVTMTEKLFARIQSPVADVTNAKLRLDVFTV